MIISKSVPLEISRKRFSQFLDSENPAEVIFVGYREEESEDGINVPKRNVKIKYADIEKYIIKAIKADPGWGQGGGSGGGNKPPTEEDVEKYDYGAVSITCGLDFDFEIQTDEEGEPILDEEGNTIPVLDDDGNPIPKLNEDGNPIINRDENDEVIIKPSDNWDEKAQSNIINLYVIVYNQIAILY